MPDETDTLIQQHLAALPTYVKDAFKAANPFQKIRKMVTDFKLHLDQGERLEQEILMVMLGLEAPDTFIDETSKSFGLSEEDSKKLVDRVSDELFVPIRDSMQKYMEEMAAKEETEAEVTEPTPATPSSLNSSAVFARPPLTAPAPIASPIPTRPVGGEAQQPATPSAPNAIDSMLSKPQSTSTERVDVGISTPKPVYKVDPYLEPPM